MRVYLDNSATTGLLPEAAEEMTKIALETYGNPSSLHLMGIEAENIIKEAAETVSSTLGVSPKELVWTSGGTESDNQALRSAAETLKRQGRHIVTSAIEHPAISKTCAWLETQGYEVSYIPVDRKGQLRLDLLEENLREDTILVSVMHVNNEIGAIEPLREISGLIRKKAPKALFHTDAVQSYGKLKISPKELGVDLLSASGHKFHGPKGTGFLYAAERARLRPILFGGGQQKNLRSGTENVPGIAGLALAAKAAYASLEADQQRMRTLREHFLKEVRDRLPDTILNGGDEEEVKTARQAPGIVSLSFPGLRSEVLLHALEEKGVFASAGSACASNHADRTSATLRAIGLKKELSDGTLRFSFSRFTTKEELTYAAEVLQDSTKALKAFVRK